MSERDLKSLLTSHLQPAAFTSTLSIVCPSSCSSRHVGPPPLPHPCGLHLPPWHGFKPAHLVLLVLLRVAAAPSLILVDSTRILCKASSPGIVLPPPPPLHSLVWKHLILRINNRRFNDGKEMNRLHTEHEYMPSQAHNHF
jgi:hypothetical protein